MSNRGNNCNRAPSVGPRLFIEALVRTGVSKTAVARHLGVSPAVIHHIVQGEREVLPGERTKIAALLGLSESECFGEITPAERDALTLEEERRTFLAQVAAIRKTHPDIPTVETLWTYRRSGQLPPGYLRGDQVYLRCPVATGSAPPRVPLLHGCLRRAESPAFGALSSAPPHEARRVDLRAPHETTSRVHAAGR